MNSAGSLLVMRMARRVTTTMVDIAVETISYIVMALSVDGEDGRSTGVRVVYNYFN